MVDYGKIHKDLDLMLAKATSRLTFRLISKTKTLAREMDATQKSLDKLEGDMKAYVEEVSHGA